MVNSHNPLDPLNASADVSLTCRGCARRRDCTCDRAPVFGKALARVRHRRRARTLRGVLSALYAPSSRSICFSRSQPALDSGKRTCSRSRGGNGGCGGDRHQDRRRLRLPALPGTDRARAEAGLAVRAKVRCSLAKKLNRSASQLLPFARHRRPAASVGERKQDPTRAGPDLRAVPRRAQGRVPGLSTRRAFCRRVELTFLIRRSCLPSSPPSTTTHSTSTRSLSTLARTTARSRLAKAARQDGRSSARSSKTLRRRASSLGGDDRRVLAWAEGGSAPL